MSEHQMILWLERLMLFKDQLIQVSTQFKIRQSEYEYSVRGNITTNGDEIQVGRVKKQKQYFNLN